MDWLEQHWYRSGLVSNLLAPLGWVYCLMATLRRGLYRSGMLRSERLPIPVIVVGNITVGGTGKTPLVIYLARYLITLGYLPGIVTRGYGGRSSTWPQDVGSDSEPDLIGDEPLLLARHASCPVVADPDRVRAARRLLDAHRCDVVLADDGLQHYRLARDLEIAVIDGARRLGNGRCLPAGPLRELPGRLAAVDARVVNGVAHPGELGMALMVTAFHSLMGGQTLSADHYRGQRVHAVAGIGNPQRFFATLRGLGVTVIEHAFPDHHRYTRADVAFDDDLPILMTEKDAVKCQSFADARMAYLAVRAQVDPGLEELIMRKLKERSSGR